jgi:rod shape determining protein RodA
MLALLGALSAFAIVAIYCATFMRDPRTYKYLVEAPRLQAIWILAGFTVFFVVSLVDYRWVKWGALPVYITGVALLVVCKFHGVTVFGAKSWIRIGGLTLQPSQVAILGGIMVVAVLLSDYRRLHPVVKLLICGAIAGPPVLLVAMQPQLGGVLVWGPVLLTMLFVGGMPLRYLVAIVLAVVGVMPLAAHLALKEFQFKRLTTFFDPESDPLGAGWTIINSMTAIGSGGWNGKGFKAHDTLVEQEMLPKTIAHTDFIFTVIGEAFGFVGSAALIAAFAMLLVTGLYVAYQAKDQVGLLLTVGVMALFFTHVFMNASMTISLTPIAGLPMPLISYGGTFVVIIMFALGLVQSVWIHRKTLR